MKKILVTGGAGFIGSHTCIDLLLKNYEVVIVDSFVNSFISAIENIKEIVSLSNPMQSKNIHYYRGDIRDKILMNKIFEEAKTNNNPIEAVIHFAGLKSVNESKINPLEYWDANFVGTITLLKVMKKFGCKHIIFSSSATIYCSSNDFPINENGIINPISPYGRTKASIEILLKDFYLSQNKKISVTNLRYFNPIGCHDSGLIGEESLGIPNNIFPLIIKVASRELKELKIFGNDWETFDGTGVRDYVHVMDVAEGHVKTLSHMIKNKYDFLNLNIGTGKGTSVLELIKTFESVNNIKIPYKFAKRRDGDLPESIADNNLAKSLLNWAPKRNIKNMCKDGWEWKRSLVKR